MGKILAKYRYTDSELLDLYRECLVHISVRGQRYNLNGVDYTSNDIDKVKNLIVWLEDRVDGDPKYASNLIRPVRRPY